MASRTQIVNIALVRMGVSQTVANVDTEKSAPAQAARLLLDDEISYVLRSFPWPWATAFVKPGLVTGSVTEKATRDWQYAYRYPNDCAFVRRVTTDCGPVDPDPPPFRIARDQFGRLILTNEVQAEVEYTSLIADASEFDGLFVSMLAWRLVMGLGASLSRIKDITSTAKAMYEMEASSAMAVALNEQQQTEPPDSEFIRARY